jgi:hypothetical protein
MTGRRDPAWLAGLALTLTGVDQFLRLPAGHAALTAWYQACGSIAPGSGAGNLIDGVSFTALALRSRPCSSTCSPEPALAWPAARLAGQALTPSLPLSFHFSSDQK